jgi:hypothetical protein
MLISRVLPKNLEISKLVVGRSGTLLLFLVSTVIVGYETCGTHDYILLSHDYRSRGTPGEPVKKSLAFYGTAFQKPTISPHSVPEESNLYHILVTQIPFNIILKSKSFPSLGAFRLIFEPNSHHSYTSYIPANPIPLNFIG